MALKSARSVDSSKDLFGCKPWLGDNHTTHSMDPHVSKDFKASALMPEAVWHQEAAHPTCWPSKATSLDATGGVPTAALSDDSRTASGFVTALDGPACLTRA